MECSKLSSAVQALDSGNVFADVHTVAAHASAQQRLNASHAPFWAQLAFRLQAGSVLPRDTVAATYLLRDYATICRRACSKSVTERNQAMRGCVVQHGATIQTGLAKACDAVAAGMDPKHIIVVMHAISSLPSSAAAPWPRMPTFEAQLTQCVNGSLFAVFPTSPLFRLCAHKEPGTASMRVASTLPYVCSRLVEFDQVHGP